MSGLFDRLDDSTRKLLRQQPQPSWVDPTLATLVHEPFSDPDWVFEPKLDGERCLLFRDGDDVRILSRNRKQLNATYPELLEAVGEQAERDCILDAEIVAFDTKGLSSFVRLQQRMQLSHPDDVRASPVTVYCYVFDVLHLAGHDTTGLPLRERKRLLAAAVDFTDPLRETPYRTSCGEDYYRRACRAGWEGALAKDAASGYAHGRSRTWLKFKCTHQQEMVIGGFTDPTGSRTHFGALLVGYYDDEKFVYAGKVGTGFTSDVLADLGTKLGQRQQQHSPFAERARERGAHWVTPELVAEIAFTEWTNDGKLRHPSYLGLRHDKNPGEVIPEQSPDTGVE